MGGDFDEWLSMAFLLLVVLPLLFFGILAFFAYRGGQRRIQEWLGTDVAKLHAEYENLISPRHGLSREQALDRVIRGQAWKAGIIGALTSIGGFVTLPIALPFDLVLSFRIQASLVSFIGQLYGGSSAGSQSATVKDYLIITGSSRFTQSSSRFLIGAALRILGKSFSKLIPVVGGLIGFGVNFTIVQVMARTVIRWHSSKQRESEMRQTVNVNRLADSSPTPNS